MSGSKVYFTNFKTEVGVSYLQKLHNLMKEAGFENIDFKDKYVAIKIHFGEYGNMSFIRPNYAKVVADYVRQLGGRPFLTDCNTLYTGSRRNALDHMDTANLNGFSYITTGCHVIIADGLKGTNETLVPLKGLDVRPAKVGTAIMDADIVISLNHFKGHEVVGFGGAVKNLGMGSGARTGKMDMHSNGKPRVTRSRCIGCGACTKVCAHDAPHVTDGLCTIDKEKCVGCGRCMGVCPADAIDADYKTSSVLLNQRIAEYALAVCQDRPNFHINMIMDISPNCDCHGENDLPILPNIGMAASFDPVALDQCCVDLCQNAPVVPGSQRDLSIRKMKAESRVIPDDPWRQSNPVTIWKPCLERAEEIGLGIRTYEMITLA
ncbi:MAG: DUF362 domain-containing protein [Lachnospiraceae bacterium]|nr:DUF362 domain-containing protein [Lachnospiraceae bacterium]